MDNQLRRAPQNLTVSAGSEQCEMENNINYNGNDDKMPDGKLKIVTARQVRLILYHLSTLYWLSPGWGRRALIRSGANIDAIACRDVVGASSPRVYNLGKGCVKSGSALCLRNQWEGLRVPAFWAPQSRLSKRIPSKRFLRHKVGQGLLVYYFLSRVKRESSMSKRV